jgi:ribosomal-protein-alanine N-acetyltransferase
VILNESGEFAGRINLNDIVRGAFHSANLGYWVSEKDQAGTLLHDAASQRVLERNGFTRIGVASAYLNIAGRWQDHVLFQVVA